MRETEVKILGIDRTITEERLRRAGAKRVFDGEIHALYYEDRGKTLRAAGRTLRLRREGGDAVLTFKTQIDDSRAKVREEKEVRVSDFGVMRSILEELGYRPWLDISKHRTSYRIENVHFELDRHTGEFAYIPEFLEIEAPDPATAFRYAETLGFMKEDCRPWDVVQVAEFYRGQGAG